jgi:hypothetical protein
VQPTHKLAIRFLWGARPHFDYGLNFQLDLHYKGFSRRSRTMVDISRSWFIFP